MLGRQLASDKPLAAEAQLAQIAPGGRGGDGPATGVLDEDHDALPRPGAGLQSCMARGSLDDGLQRRQLCGGQPGARLPTQPGMQPSQPVSIEATDPVLHRPPAPAQLPGDVLSWLAVHEPVLGPATAPAGGDAGAVACAVVPRSLFPHAPGLTSHRVCRHPPFSTSISVSMLPDEMPGFKHTQL